MPRSIEFSSMIVSDHIVMAKLVASKTNPPLGALITAEAVSSKVKVTTSWGQETSFTSPAAGASSTSSGIARWVRILNSLCLSKCCLLSPMDQVSWPCPISEKTIVISTYHQMFGEAEWFTVWIRFCAGEDWGGSLAHLQSGTSLLSLWTPGVSHLPWLCPPACNIPGKY